MHSRPHDRATRKLMLLGTASFIRHPLSSCLVFLNMWTKEKMYSLRSGHHRLLHTQPLLSEVFTYVLRLGRLSRDGRQGLVFLSISFQSWSDPIVLADRAPSPQWCYLWCYLYRMRATRPPQRTWRAIAGYSDWPLCWSTISRLENTQCCHSRSLIIGGCVFIS